MAWKTYDCDYQHDDAHWTFSIMAPDWDDAKARVAHIRQSAVLDGEVVATVRCTPRTMRWTGIAVQAFCNVANEIRRLLGRA